MTKRTRRNIHLMLVRFAAAAILLFFIGTKWIYPLYAIMAILMCPCGEPAKGFGDMPKREIHELQWAIRAVSVLCAIVACQDGKTVGTIVCLLMVMMVSYPL